MSTAASAQVFVYPRRPNKSQVRYFDFQWRHVDIEVAPQADLSDAQALSQSVGASPGADGGVPAAALPTPPSPPLTLAADGGTPDAPTPRVGARPYAHVWESDPALASRRGGVRLYFYERERAVAERAASLISDAYRTLVGQFRYVPTRTFPYILYSSYQEFLQTNLFPLQEGVLGVTSTRGDLKLTLPYFGDHRMFQSISAHEMAHQFTIQKVRTLADQAKAASDPLERLPLWFIEGLAEFYAYDEKLDDETEMLARDLVVHPDVANGYALIDFFEDRPGSFLWTYKLGQVRCFFLEDVYGKGMVQRVLEATPRLVGNWLERPRSSEFADLLRQLTGDEPEALSKKFEAWLKRRTFQAYLGAKQDVPELSRIEGAQGIVDALDTSPDGALMLYRRLDRETGRAYLVLSDVRDVAGGRSIASDGLPGFESLHPVFGRNFDLGANVLAFIAETRGRDVIYLQRYEHSARPARPPTPQQRSAPPDTREPLVDARINLKERWSISLRPHGILAAYSPALSPDGSQIAFVGLSDDGRRDVYALSLSRPEEVPRKLTDDVFAEREVAWGPSGVYFTSDATPHGKYNVFWLKEGADAPLRLSTEARDHRDLAALPDGRVVIAAYDQAKGDLYELKPGENGGPAALVRLTDSVTGVFQPSPGRSGGLVALLHYAGERRPVRIPVSALAARQTTLQTPDAVLPSALPSTALTHARPYRALSLSNWELGPPFALLGAGAGGIFGQVVASATDRLLNHALLLNAAFFGSFELTDGFLFYINQERRLTYGGGPFQSLRFRRDRTFPALGYTFSSGERFFGAQASIRFPLDRFVYVQTDLALGGAAYFLLSGEREALLLQGLFAQWEAANHGVRFQTEGAIRFGYDTIRYHGATGPLAGTSWMVEGTATAQPFSRVEFGTLRLDAERFFPVEGRTNFFVRGSFGTTFGGRLATQFFLSSFDTLRGVRFGDEYWLLGRHYFFTTAELQFPLNALLQFAFFTDIEGILAVDFGAVGDELRSILNKRVLDLVVGVNFALGPILLRLHFAKPQGIGADPIPPTVLGRYSPAGVPGGWVTNFSLGLVGLEGALFKGMYRDKPVARLRQRPVLRHSTTSSRTIQ